MALYDDHRANVGAQEAQWLTLFTEPADHPKRRRIDLNEEPSTQHSILNFQAMKFLSGLCKPQVQLSIRTKFPGNGLVIKRCVEAPAVSEIPF
ncbi:TMV resistance protein N-like [Prunus yedoensis var. nudiflora]|uniref:TMV resistance protein N-like n=1 Tax=Prunus yedoensis var. nudiflora TaxID=2094558 RepID=A0A314UIW3_PRUYE|nr:TMV resistance protein N-like [Prunus yedoensis var. nudiflora]